MQAKCYEVEVRNSGIPGLNVIFHLEACLVQEVTQQKVKEINLAFHSEILGSHQKVTSHVPLQRPVTAKEGCF